MDQQDSLAEDIARSCAQNGLEGLAVHFLGGTAPGSTGGQLPWELDTCVTREADCAVNAMVKGTAEDRETARRIYLSMLCCPMDGEEAVLFNDACWELFLDRTLSWVQTPIAGSWQQLSSHVWTSTDILDFVLNVFVHKVNPEAVPFSKFIQFVSKDVAVVVWAPLWPDIFDKKKGLITQMVTRPKWILGPCIPDARIKHFAFLAINLQDAKVIIVDPLVPNPKRQPTSDDLPKWLTSDLFNEEQKDTDMNVSGLVFLCLFGLLWVTTATFGSLCLDIKIKLY